MKLRRNILLVLVLLMALLCVPAALADTGVKGETGAFAAMADGKIFMILPTDAGSSLYSMPEAGGTMTLIENAPQINDLIAGPDGSIYYLRYTGAAFQVVVRSTDGARSALATFEPGQIAYSLTYYDGTLFCLVDNKLHRVDESGAAAVSSRQIGSYTIADGIIYYEAKEDEVSYDREHTTASGEAVTVTSSAGAMYAMNLDGSNDMRQFDQGVSNLDAYGEYVYFHNYNDSYVVAGTPDAWLDGKLYRLNVQTNQYKLLRDGYDWNYRPVDLGLVIYQERALSIAAQDGSNPVLIYEPDPYNYIALLEDCAIVYEYNLQKLTRVPYDQTKFSVLLWDGAFVADNSTGETIAEDEPLPAGSTKPGTGMDLTGSTDTTTTGSTTGTTTGSTATESTTGVTENGSLYYGATGEKVRALQERLHELGYLSYVDGVFGEKTQTAVKRFQRAAGLTVDGVAGKNTLYRLNRDDAPEYDGSTATDSSYIFPHSSSEKLTRSEILSISSSLWPYARNEIYARHGYSFDNVKFQEYFESKTWYSEGGFSTSDLNSIEWYNMELIRDMENGLDSGDDDDDDSDVDYDDDDDYIFPQSSTRKLTKSEIRAVDSDLWPYARNEIYARHGYKFTKAKFRNYFNSKSWYEAGGFSTEDISEIEWYNMELIRWMEENEG